MQPIKACIYYLAGWVPKSYPQSHYILGSWGEQHAEWVSDMIQFRYHNGLARQVKEYLYLVMWWSYTWIPKHNKIWRVGSLMTACHFRGNELMQGRLVSCKSKRWYPTRRYSCSRDTNSYSNSAHVHRGPPPVKASSPPAWSTVNHVSCQHACSCPSTSALLKIVQY